MRAALLLVERGEAPVGIVYASDVRAAPDLTIAATLPDDSHLPIIYPGAVSKNAAMPHEAEQLLAFLAGNAAQSIFRALEFLAPPAPPAR